MQAALHGCEWVSTSSLLSRHQRSQWPSFGRTSEEVLESTVEAVYRGAPMVFFGLRRRSYREAAAAGKQQPRGAAGERALRDLIGHFGWH